MPEKAMDTIPVLNDDTIYLVPLCAGIIRAKLRREEFVFPIDLNSNKIEILFPREWPGDILFAFENWSEQCEFDTDIIPGTFIIIDRESLSAIGAIGTKSYNFLQPAIEVGYGVTPFAQRRGFATKALQLICGWLFTFTEILYITAETSQNNSASQKVLEKCGFRKTGTGWNEDDGDLFLWRLNRM